MNNLKLHLVQFDIIWEDATANRTKLDSLFKAQDLNDSIILLPEMFTTGFSGHSALLAEEMTGITIQWMKSHARALNSVLAGTIIIKENQKYFNRFLWVQPDGKVHYYDKRHLFRMSDEPEHFSPGNRIVDVEYLGWKFRILTCYDLRFPVWARNNSNYDLLIYSANWPASRREVWLSLLKARAIENLAYVAGINRTGTDGKEIPYSGDSLVYNFKGESLLNCRDKEDIFTLELYKEDLNSFRNKFPAHLDRDEFKIIF